MVWARKSCLAIFLGGTLSLVGCCYHAAHYGGERDIGIGEIGCGTCKAHCQSCGPAPCAPCSRRAGLEQGGLATAMDFAPNTVVPVVYTDSGEPPQSGRDFRRGERSSDLPVYVLPPESLSNGLIVSPNPLPTFAPPPAASRQRPVRQ